MDQHISRAAEVSFTQSLKCITKLQDTQNNKAHFYPLVSPSLSPSVQKAIEECSELEKATRALQCILEPNPIVKYASIGWK